MTHSYVDTTHVDMTHLIRSYVDIFWACRRYILRVLPIYYARNGAPQYILGVTELPDIFWA